MKFSIITPSYNQGRFIRDCIESVRAQTGMDWEHIVVDACSTDETLGILKEYPHLQWTSEPDKGQTDAINKGFRRATGEWVMWLNGDDYLLPGALLKVAEFAAQHPEADVIYGMCQFVTVDKQFIRLMRSVPFNLRMMVHSTPYIASTACFYKRATTVEQGILVREELRYVMDTEYYAHLGQAGKVFRYLREPLAAYRWHDAQQSRHNRCARDFGTVLELQKQYAESDAVRRLYGVTLSDNPMVTKLVDFLLYFYYCSKKVCLRRLLHLFS